MIGAKYTINNEFIPQGINPLQAAEFMLLLKRTPFIPLRIFMTEGRSFDLLQPRGSPVLESRLDIGIPPDSSTGVFERIESCSWQQMLRIKAL